MDIENQILKEVQDIFGGAYPQMMAEAMGKCPTLKKLLKTDHYFYMQECIAVKDASLITKSNATKLAEMIGCNRGSLNKHVKNNPERPVMVHRNGDGVIVDLSW